MKANSGFETEKSYYLAENVYFEPLINQWYAWPYLLSPASASRHVVNTHRRIMSSFVNNYELHILASKESVMAGGEFLNCSADQVSDIRRLIAHIDENCADLIELSDAIRQLDDLLRAHTSGETLEHLYPKVPEALRGFVELHFDMEHRASFRLIEPLLYKSKFYNKSLQSVSFGKLTSDGDRPFVLSTPRLADDKHLQVAVDFNDKFLDPLFRSREHPLSAAEVDSLFDQLSLSGGLTPRQLFNDEPSPYRYRPVDYDQGLRLRYTGHAGFTVETADLTIMIDPVISSRCERFTDDVISFTELPPHIDYVCLTHNHQDHVNFETLLQLRYKIGKVVVPKNNGGTLADPSLKLMLRQLNFDVLEIDELEEIALPGGGRIVSVPFLGEHGDLNIRSKCAWLIEAGGRKVFFGADSSNPDIRLYENMREVLSNIDVFCIGMECVGAPYTWLYGALHTKPVGKSIKNSRRLNGSDFRQAFDIVSLLRPKEVYIYALGIEPWYKYFMGIDYSDDSKQIVESKKLIDGCKSIGIHAESLYGKKTLAFAWQES